VFENIPTFVTEFGSPDFFFRSEKGIRFESGAVPAAVSLYKNFPKPSPLSGQSDGKASENKVSQKTCQINKFIIAFGIKAMR